MFNKKVNTTKAINICLLSIPLSASLKNIKFYKAIITAMTCVYNFRDIIRLHIMQKRVERNTYI